jgi:hypothetical protein
MARTDDGLGIMKQPVLIATSPEVSFMTYIREIPMGDSKGYAVCTEDGMQLAVFQTPEAAYFSARQFNLTPVSVH